MPSLRCFSPSFTTPIPESLTCAAGIFSTQPGVSSRTGSYFRPSQNNYLFPRARRCQDISHLLLQPAESKKKGKQDTCQAHTEGVPLIKKYFGKDDWNAGMASSLCLTGEFPLIADRVWTGTRQRGGCTLPGWLTWLEVHICWVLGYIFSHQYQCAINTREKGAPR